ncbi:MAG TPA: EAL domain-containing protein [Terracidiphilus sp.]|nr:EAL domain-containing protein [Terracidiphilus sp.]
MKATSRMFTLMLLSMLVLVGLSFAGSWEIDHLNSASPGNSPANQSKTGIHRAEQQPAIDQAQKIRNLIAIVQGLSLIACGALYGFGMRLRDKGRRDERERQAAELALEIRVEERTRDLRKEVEERRLVEHLHRGQRRIMEMLAEPGDMKPEDILRFLADTVAARNQGWECALHLMDRRGKSLQLAASSEVTEGLGNYFKAVGTEYADSPECQACASGETHIVEHLGEIGLEWSEVLSQNGIFSAWSIPFCAEASTRLAGTMTIYSRSRCKPTAHELEMSESAAKLAALILEHRRLRSELIHNAYLDALTGLPNRRAGVQAIDSAISKARAHRGSVAVLWIDINRFKRVNDQFGHDAGDHVLRTVAERLRRSPLNTGSVARMGEDQFLVVIPGTEDSLDTVEISRRLGSAIAKPIYSGSTRITVSASIGSCIYPQDGETAEILERNADFAMFRAKSSGESYCVFSSAMSQEANEGIEIEEALGVALEKNYLRLVYQPLYSIEGELTGFEALIRFHHPRLGNIPPARFIPVAEDTRMIVPIGNWVLREACKQLKRWHEAGLPRVRMSVNISALQFARDDFADTVANTFSECGLEPEHLVLELTESVIMEDYASVVSQMNLLRQCGVHIAMDDFGTGYSSLSYIHRIPVNILKIDRSFIERLAEPDGTRPIVEAVIAMAKHLGLHVVAEGVETVDQQRILKQAGCQGYQGYLFARPMPADEAESCLKASLTVPFAKSTVQPEGDGLAVA